MRAVPFIQTLAAIALLAIPAMASAAPDQNSNPNQNGCGYYNSNHQWVGTPCNNGNGQSNNGQNGQWNNGQNGQWNNGQRNRRDGDRDDQRGNGRGGWNGRGNGQAGNQANQLNGSVSSFSPYNLYLNNGTHVELHNGTIISPTGANLARGQRVVVRGNWNGDGSYNANEIDVINNNNGYNGYNR
ncbi:MAG: hypothetical protein ABI186_09855 [Candidatus Elarobacter sp.]